MKRCQYSLRSLVLIALVGGPFLALIAGAAQQCVQMQRIEIANLNAAIVNVESAYTYADALRHAKGKTQDN